MAKVKHLIALHFFLTFLYPLAAQEYRVHYRHDENDSAKLDGRLSLQNVFTDRTSALSYINGLPAQLKNSGFLAASIDEIRADSAEAFVVLYLGERYEWAAITPDSAAAAIMQAIRVPGEVFRGAVDFNTLNTWQQRILDHLEEYGHPFGRVFLDSITISGNRVDALLRVNPGPLYRIDSIRVYGDAKVSNEFLQRHLQLQNGSLYNKKKLLSISSRIAELTYVQEEKPFDLSLLGTGSVLNLYLKNRKSSQVNALIGFLPNSDQAADKKFVITADVNILLRNSLSNGETIGLVWQQLQQKSPRLNLLFEQPFIMRSAFGVRFAFDMFRKDSSFLNINLHLGTTYRIGDRKSASVFLQRFQTIVNQVNEAQVIQTRTL
ncbi:MAG TPA: hypothetical protein VFZ78_07915, partial [Flavisolibacter sp.]